MSAWKLLQGILEAIIFHISLSFIRLFEGKERFICTCGLNKQIAHNRDSSSQTHTLTHAQQTHTYCGPHTHTQLQLAAGERTRSFACLSQGQFSLPHLALYVSLRVSLCVCAIVYQYKHSSFAYATHTHTETRTYKGSQRLSFNQAGQAGRGPQRLVRDSNAP